MPSLSGNTRTALILGATGGVGGAIARVLHDHGWTVRAMVRDASKAEADWKGLGSMPQFVSGNAMTKDDVIRAATDGGSVSVIVHAVNPPSYQNWEKLVLPMMDNTIAAASAAGGARVVLPGTVYNYDPALTEVIDAETPQNATIRKGRIRARLEQKLVGAAPDVPSLIVRAGDFFGPGSRSSWFAQAMVKPGKQVRKVTSLAPGVPHAYAYLPDLAETFAQLLDKPDCLTAQECVQFEGTWDADGRTVLEAIRAAIGRDVPERAFPWWLMHLAAPFGGFPKEAVEIEPIWRRPMRLDNTRLVEILGHEPRTQLNAAMRATLTSMNCLPQIEEPGAAS